MSSCHQPLVLLIEDSDDDAYFFDRAVKKAGVGCEVVRVGNGTAAVRLLETLFSPGPPSKSNRPDFIFLDLKLPGLSGFEILQWLGDRSVLHHFRISILSGSESHTDINRARELGVLDYLVKPVAPDVLRTRLIEWRPRIRGSGSVDAAGKT